MNKVNLLHAIISAYKEYEKNIEYLDIAINIMYQNQNNDSLNVNELIHDLLHLNFDKIMSIILSTYSGSTILVCLLNQFDKFKQ